MNLINLTKKFLAKNNLKIVRTYPHWPELWSKDVEFEEIMRAIESHTLLPYDRCYFIYQIARNASRLEGDFAEFGVYKGGSAYLISMAAKNKTVHLFDTFTGMPEVNKPIDKHSKGDFADTNLENVQKFLNNKNFVFYKGFFPDTTASLESEIKFSLVHIDVDIYKSLEDALEFFYQRVVPGGVILFDDYDSLKCPGIKKAIDEFLEKKPERVIRTTFHQAMLIKS